MERDVALTMLKNCAQFRGVKKTELHTLLSSATRTHFAANETIYTKGEPSNDKFGMIISGSVKVVKGDGSVLRLVGNSQVIGEIAVSESQHQARTVTMIATEPTEVMEWYVSFIKEKLPKVWKNLQQLAGAHLSNFYES